MSNSFTRISSRSSSFILCRLAIAVVVVVVLAVFFLFLCAEYYVFFTFVFFLLISCLPSFSLEHRFGVSNYNFHNNFLVRSIMHTHIHTLLIEC